MNTYLQPVEGFDNLDCFDILNDMRSDLLGLHHLALAVSVSESDAQGYRLISNIAYSMACTLEKVVNTWERGEPGAS